MPKKPFVTRRQFASAVATNSGCLLGSSALSLPIVSGNQRQTDRYSFLLFGDTHFDRLEHHDFDWMRKHYAKDIRQVENYCRLTREKLPELLTLAKRVIQSSEVAPEFALHVGDLVEGICGNADLARRHCEEAWEFFQEAGLGIPLLMTKGNHDVTGPGSIEAFEQVLLQKAAKELGRDSLERTSYSFRRGRHLFAVFDAYDRNAIDWLEQLTAQHDFERLFVLMHLPVVPYNARANWRVYYHTKQSERRERLIDVLGKHHAVVLCGHLHKYSLLARKTKQGKFAQLAMSSIHKAKPASSVLRSVEDYGPELTSMEPSFSPETIDVRREILQSEREWIDHFEYRDSYGLAVVHVDADKISVDLHEENSLEPTRNIDVSRILATS